MSAGADLFVGSVWVAIYFVSGESVWLWAGTFLIGLGRGRIGQRQMDAT